MERALTEAIVKRSKSVIKKQKLKQWIARKHAKNYKKRTGKDPILKTFKPPKTWALHPHFNPTYCIKHRKYLARIIWKKVQEGTYSPTPAVMSEIPKPNGEKRQVMAFSIPDAAIAKIFRSKLNHRTSKTFSSHSYAYRFDKNLFDALLHVQAAIKGEKVFIIQYDFEKYFDSITHQYVKKLIRVRDLFFVSTVEQKLLKSFLTHQYASREDYENKKFKKKEKGIPQGSSLSLWLANVAGHELDRNLERVNGQFARFADDVICIAHSYEDALKIATVFEEHCKNTGLRINKRKSPGINLLSDGTKGKLLSDAAKELEKKGIMRNTEEMRSVTHFDYLGHRFEKGGIYLTDKAVKRIKQKISRIIQIHLLHYLKKKEGFNQNRIGSTHFDWDLTTCLNEVRRYIYGGLTEANIHNLIFKNIRLPKMRGLMSFYVLISDPDQLKELDGWLMNSIRRALIERYRIIKAEHNLSQKALSVAELKSGKWYNNSEVKLETRCPSFLRGWRGARKYYLRFGLNDVTPPRYYNYNQTDYDFKAEYDLKS